MQYNAVQKMRMHDALEKNRTLAVFGMVFVAVAFVGVSSVVVVNTEASCHSPGLRPASGDAQPRGAGGQRQGTRALLEAHGMAWCRTR